MSQTNSNTDVSVNNQGQPVSSDQDKPAYTSILQSHVIKYQTAAYIKQEVTRIYLDSLDLDNPPPPPQITEELLTLVQNEITLANSIRTKEVKFKIPQTLSPAQMADILIKLHHAIMLRTSDADNQKRNGLPAIYDAETGLYTVNELDIHYLLKQYLYEINERTFKEILRELQACAPSKSRTSEKHLIAVNNGIFNYNLKILMPFSPDYIFLNKSCIDYNDQAKNITIHNNNDNTDWDFDSWMQSLSDDPGIVKLLWQIMGAVVRPNVPWNKSAWLYSEKGNNGKGTFCSILRSLCGEDACASISLSDMGIDFHLEPLIGATAIVVDENDVGIFIDKAANLKAIITGDAIMINRKFQKPISYQFHGFMVQCLNEMPRIKDKSDSFFRRQIFIPFDKCFTGKERTYIKQDYLKRKDVLEYVLYTVLHMDYETFDIPKSCENALNDYKTANDVIRQFVEEIIMECVWDILPFPFLYDLYKNWMKDDNPNGTIVGKQTFIRNLLTILDSYPDWTCPGKDASIWTGINMAAMEPLLYQYDLKKWMNPHGKAGDIKSLCTPAPGQYAKAYRGLIRNKPTQPNSNRTNNQDRKEE